MENLFPDSADLLNGQLKDIWDGDAQSVRVAVRSRPLSAQEKMAEASDCIRLSFSNQLKLGSKYFTFDAVYDSASSQNNIYTECISKLVSSCFDGFNATVLAYGQTGSGKTYTMGSTSAGNVLDEEQGIIPRAIRQIFEEIAERKRRETGLKIKVLVSFLEIYNEEIKDLLDPQPSIPGKAKSITLRENLNGSIQVAGANEEVVTSCEEMLQCLEKGTVCRSVGSTSMNAVSSRSHAIFTVTIEQEKFLVDDTIDGGEGAEGGTAGAATAATCCSSIASKFHFVDLAGSERAKRTQAAGDRLKEGININYGLLVLGNVISALGDETRKGSHVPYRDSKLTRMLQAEQDSIGGNSRTLMIACVSPADTNFAESYNTLVYANRARNIKNKPIVNRDPREAQLAALHEQIARLKLERDLALRQAGLGDGDMARLAAQEMASASATAGGGGSGGDGERQRLVRENQSLAQRLERSEAELGEARRAVAEVREVERAAAAERDGYRVQLEEALGRPATAGGDGLTLLEQRAQECEEVRRQLEEREREYVALLDRFNKREQDLKNDQRIFSAKNKKLSVLAKQNQALKAENQNMMRRISMSPAVGAGLGTPGSARACVESSDSPTQLGEVRRRLDGVVGGFKSRAEAEGEGDLLGEELLEGDSGDEPEEAPTTHEQLAEEEERRWRQGLLQLDVEVRDLSSTIDSKEKLLEKLMQSQVEMEKMRQTFESRLAEASQAVRLAEQDANKALQAVERVKSKDEEEKVQLQKDHALKLKELEAKTARMQREEKDFKRWIQQKEQDQKRINALQEEIERNKQQKTLLVKKMKDNEDRYREWRERHHKEVQQLKRSAIKAEYTIRKLERENAKYKAVLRRREEEKAAAQRNSREIALANARTAKLSVTAAPVVASSLSAGSQAADCGAGRGSYKLRSQTIERIDHFKMNRVKARLDSMLKEYGQRGKLKAESMRLRVDLKAVGEEVRLLTERRDRLQLEVERRAAAAAAGGTGVDSAKKLLALEADGVRRESGVGSKRKSGVMEGEETRDAQELLIELSEAIDEQETKADYHRERLAEVEKRLKALPDFGGTGVWSDDDCIDVPEAFAPLKEVNGSEAKFLLRFLFKRAATFRESDVKAATQLELQRIAIEEHRRERENAVGALRRAELSFEQRCANLQETHEGKCLMLYAKVNGEATRSSLGEADSEGTPTTALEEHLRQALRTRDEELALLRAAHEALQRDKDECQRLLSEANSVADGVMAAPQLRLPAAAAAAVAGLLEGGVALSEPSSSVRALSAKLLNLRSIIQRTKADGSGSGEAAPVRGETPPHGRTGRASSSSADSDEAAGPGGGSGGAGQPASSEDVLDVLGSETPAHMRAFKKNVFDRLTAERNKVGQSKYKKLDTIKFRIQILPAFTDWADLAGSKRQADAKATPAASRGPAAVAVAAVTSAASHAAAVTENAAGETNKENRLRPAGAGDGGAADGDPLLKRLFEGSPSEAADGQQALMHANSRSSSSSGSGGSADVWARLQDPSKFTGIHKHAEACRAVDPNQTPQNAKRAGGVLFTDSAKGPSGPSKLKGFETPSKP